MIATIVDTDALLQVIWVSIIAGVGVTAGYGFGILGTARTVELGREGRLAEAILLAIVGAVGYAVVIAAIVWGILMLVND